MTTDTSKLYYTKASKALEIQALRPPVDQCLYNNFKKIPQRRANRGDWFARYIRYECMSDDIVTIETKSGDYVVDRRFTWLPTFSQLCQIAIDYKRCENWRVFVYCISEDYAKYSRPELPSMEQAALHFIMKDKFQKEWNPETEEWESILLLPTNKCSNRDWDKTGETLCKLSKDPKNILKPLSPCNYPYCDNYKEINPKE